MILPRSSSNKSVYRKRADTHKEGVSHWNSSSGSREVHLCPTMLREMGVEDHRGTLLQASSPPRARSIKL